MGQSTQFHFRTELFEWEVEARIEKLNRFLQCNIGDFLGVDSDVVATEKEFSSLMKSLGADEQKTAELTTHLFDVIKQSMDLHFFFFEHKIDTIALLSKLISDQIEIIWKPAKPKQIEQMSAEPQNWPWIIRGADQPNENKIQRKTIFLLSCPRSGSTISRLILAGHPQLFSPPELHLLPFSSMGEREEQILRNDFDWMKMGLVDTFIELENLSFEDAVKRYQDLVEQDVSIQEVYELLYEMIGDRILVDKTPFYACHVDWLRRAEQVFANPQYVFLARHPYGMISSFVKLRLINLTFDKFGPVDDNPWRLGEKWWFTGNNNIIQFLESIPEERRFSIRYEDLVAESEKYVAQICHFLGIEFVESILNPYKNSSDVMIKGVGDPNIMAYNTINKSLADAWKKTPPPQDLSVDTRALAKYLRYTIL